MSKNGFALIIVVAITTSLILGGLTSYMIMRHRQIQSANVQTDEHGCLVSAGYTWCDSQQKCLNTKKDLCKRVTNPPVSNKAYLVPSTLKPDTVTTETTPLINKYCQRCKLRLGDQKKECYLCALTTKNPLWCNYVNNTIDRYTCNLSYRYALKKSLKGYCETIQNTTHKNACLTLSAIYENDISDCEAIKDSSANLFCYVQYAKSKNDIGLCKLYTKAPWECYAHYAAQENNVELCKTGTLNLNSQDLCIAMFSELTKQVNACNNSSSMQNVAACYASVAMIDHNASLCDKLSDRYWKSFCYASYGFDQNKDYTICQQIYSDPLRIGDQALCLGIYGKLSGMKSQICNQLHLSGITEADNKALSLCRDTANQ